MSKLTRRIVADLKATWGNKAEPVEEKRMTKGEQKYWRDKWTVIKNYYDKKDDKR
jgi:hypothetical protein